MTVGVFSPFELGILLHYYGCADDHRAVIEEVPIWPETRDRLMALGLLTTAMHDDGGGRMYQLTEKGEFFVDQGLRQVPVPVQSFKFPERS